MPVSISAMVDASKRGYGLHKWVNDKVPNSTEISCGWEGYYEPIT